MKNSSVSLGLAHRDVVIWALLVAFTLVSWWLGHGQEQLGSSVLTALILLVAVIKARLVILNFMELRTAPLALRLVLEAWCVGVYMMLVFLLLY